MSVTEEMGIDGEEESWVSHYSSNHKILLVGDGDFSFSLSLAHSFRSASNIVASSLDSYVEVITKYKDAESNLKELEELGAAHLHGVDATKMKLHSDLKMQKFDRIIFNFPHAGFSGKEDDVRLIKKHKKLVSSFFANARGMLRANGEIHVNHKTTPPFCCWNLEELACRNSLALVKCVDFKKESYPGYNNKRGDGSRCNNPFPLGKCSTFIFRFFRSAAKCKVKAHICSRVKISSQPPQFPSGMNEWHAPFQMDRMFEQPREVPFQMQHLSNLRFEQPREAPYRMQHMSASSGFDASMSNIPLHTMDRRFYQSQEDPYRMEYPSASFALDPSPSHLPLILREAPFGMQHPVSTFGIYPSMSDIPSLHSRDGRYHQPQEAPLQMNYPSASFDSDISMRNMPLSLWSERTHPSAVPVPYQIQEQTSLFDSNARNILFPERLLRSQINDRASWIHGPTGGDATYLVLDRGPNLHYERFLY